MYFASNKTRTNKNLKPTTKKGNNNELIYVGGKSLHLRVCKK